MRDLITIREAISLVRKGIKEVSADSRCTNKYIYSVLRAWIKSILSRDSDSFRLSNRESVYQTLKCIEVIEAPLIDPCCGLRSRCKVFRTKDRLPEILEDSDGPRITLVAPIDSLVKPTGSDNSLSVILAKDLRRRLENPWAKFNVEGYAVYNDGYLYLPNRSWRMIMVEAIFLEEIESDCEKTSDSSCKRFMDKRLYVPERQLQEAVNKTIEEILARYKRIPEQQLIDKNQNT